MSDALGVFRRELRAAAAHRVARRRSRRRVLVTGTALLVAVAAAGLAVATTGVFRATPAPPDVVENFSLYTPQLGYDPIPGAAELVAEDGEFRLYRTPNRQGGYCVTWTAPRAPRTLEDGGTCMSKKAAAEPLVAGIVGGDSGKLIVAGRVRQSGAVTIRLTAHDGSLVERPIGADGFFVAAVALEICPPSDWAPEFVALGAGGTDVARGVIWLVDVDPRGTACGMSATFHGPSR